jgi:pimeloyl-ACP methyl ester carboxylesterase
MTPVKAIFRPLHWGFAALGLAALATGATFAVPVTQPPELVSIHSSASAIMTADISGPLSWLFGATETGLCIVGALALLVGALLAVPVSRPPELASISAGRNAIDTSGLPNLSRYRARDGSELAYRFYAAADSGTIAILIHGSGGVASGLNQIARALVAKGIAVVVPDIRGFGSSGTRGDIGYLGQLDDDMADLAAELRRQFPQARFDLLGFSSGGAFALRVAAGKLSTAFERLVLLSPYLGYLAPSTKSAKTAPRWANANLPRVLTLGFLHRLGIRFGESLPLIAFAVPPGSEASQSAQWSYRLLMNFGAPADLTGAFRSLRSRTTIIAGDSDELIASEKFVDMVQGIEPKIAVKIVPGPDHMGMLHRPAAIEAVTTAFAA